MKKLLFIFVALCGAVVLNGAERDFKRRRVEQLPLYEYAGWEAFKPKAKEILVPATPEQSDDDMFDPLTPPDSYYVPETPPHQIPGYQQPSDDAAGDAAGDGAGAAEQVDYSQARTSEQLEELMPPSQRAFGDVVIDLQGTITYENYEVFVPGTDADAIPYRTLAEAMFGLNDFYKRNYKARVLETDVHLRSDRREPQKLRLNSSALWLKDLFVRTLCFDPEARKIEIANQFDLIAFRFSRARALNQVEPLADGHFTVLVNPVLAVPDGKVPVEIEIVED